MIRLMMASLEIAPGSPVKKYPAIMANVVATAKVKTWLLDLENLRMYIAEIK
jgi:hypothetical protein